MPSNCLNFSILEPDANVKVDLLTLPGSAHMVNPDAREENTEKEVVRAFDLNYIDQKAAPSCRMTRGLMQLSSLQTKVNKQASVT